HVHDLVGLRRVVTDGAEDEAAVSLDEEIPGVFGITRLERGDPRLHHGPSDQWLGYSSEATEGQRVRTARAGPVTSPRPGSSAPRRRRAPGWRATRPTATASAAPRPLPPPAAAPPGRPRRRTRGA